MEKKANGSIARVKPNKRGSLGFCELSPFGFERGETRAYRFAPAAPVERRKKRVAPGTLE